MELQAEGEVQSLTKRVRSLEEEFEGTESRLQAANEKLDEASKAADESERLEAYRLLMCLIPPSLSCLLCRYSQ